MIFLLTFILILKTNLFIQPDLENNAGIRIQNAEEILKESEKERETLDLKSSKSLKLGVLDKLKAPVGFF